MYLKTSIVQRLQWKTPCPLFSIYYSPPLIRICSGRFTDYTPLKTTIQMKMSLTKTYDRFRRKRSEMENKGYKNLLSKLQVSFYQKGSKSLPKFTSENLKNKPVEDPMDVTSIGSSWLVRTLWMSKLSEMTPSNALVLKPLFFKFSDVNLGSDFDPF